MTIAEAVIEVMKMTGKPMFVREITQIIIEESLFSFNTEKPNEMVRRAINRLCEGSPRKDALDTKRFVRLPDGTYWLKDFLLNSQEEIRELASTQERVEADGYFNPISIEDARKRIRTSIVQRQGQNKFRQQLLEAYNRRCAITSFNAEQALEAAHIHPYKGPDTNKVTNGLLLRADIHTLFDLYLIGVYPEIKEVDSTPIFEVRIAPEIRDTSYSELKALYPPQDKRLWPSTDALEWHYKQCDWK